MSKAKYSLTKKLRLLVLAVVVALIIYIVVRNVNFFGNALVVLLGFGAVVLVHEFGHFISAKLAGIKVEAFSIFMPPTLASVQRTESGFKFRLLPNFFRKKGEDSRDDLLSFTVGKKGKSGETEYRIGLIPFGGFVKMLGQDDIGPVKAIDDPRSFANKPAGIRAMVITAGVFFNALSAVAIFMIVFLIGINLKPAVVGGIIPGSPAELAGLKAGDEIIEIDGEREYLDFFNIAMPGALSNANQPVEMQVRHENGSIEDYSIVAKQMLGEPLKGFGILRPMSLNIARVSDVNALVETTGLMPGDIIKSINGIDVQAYWELEQIVQNALVQQVAVLAERREKTGKVELVESQIQMGLKFAETYNVKFESELYHIYSMVPRLRIKAVVARHSSIKEGLTSLLWSLLNRIGVKKRSLDTQQELKEGDIILSAGGVENPTYKEMRNIVEEYENKNLLLKVLRKEPNGVEKHLTVSVMPKRRKDLDWVEIGIVIVLDSEHPVVAKTIDTDTGPPALAIPRGATITALDGKTVSNFYDIIEHIRQNEGKRITIDYRLNDKKAGSIALNVESSKDFVTVKSAFAEFVPFEELTKLYKADGPVEAVKIGYKKTVMFIVQTYLTVKQLVSGLISPKNLIGPVGIITLSYRVVAEQPLIYYAYLLGLISACIAVFNFLPLPPLDGGLIVLLLVEKIKGSALSETTQGIMAYAGWTLVGALFLYVTFNDFVRAFFG